MEGILTGHFREGIVDERLTGKSAVMRADEIAQLRIISIRPDGILARPQLSPRRILAQHNTVAEMIERRNAAKLRVEVQD